MNIHSLLRLELRRLLSGRNTWLAILFSLLLPVTGYTLLPLLSWNTMAVKYLANPISAGTLGATMLFSALTLYELSRAHRSRMDAITDSIVSPLLLTSMLLLCLSFCVLLTAGLGFLLYLPYTCLKMGIVFSMEDYVLCWFLLFFPGPVFGILASAACYLITARADVSFLSIAAFLSISRSGRQADNPWWQWSLPALTALSDDFSNADVFRVASYCRMIWLCILLGSLLLALHCIRRYRKSLFCSLFLRLRKPLSILPALFLLVSGGLLWHFQPFFDHSPTDWITAFYSHPEHTAEHIVLTGSELTADISDAARGILSGRAVYHIENTSGQPGEMYFHLNSGYTIRSATLNGLPVILTKDPSDLLARCDYICPLPANKDITLEISYGGTLRTWNQTSGIFGSTTISRKYIELAGYSLMPVPQLETKSQDTPLLVSFVIPDRLIPVTTGYATELLSDNKDGTKTWAASDTGVTAIRLFAADYVKKELNTSGLAFELYYSQKHQRQLDEMDAISVIESTIDYCTRNYGPRSFEEGKPFKLIQCPEFMFGGFASQNVSGMLEESFSVPNLRDTEKGSSGAEVLAHEIIHQWWGLSAMFMDAEEPYWTSEGLTTYSTYRLAEALYGEDYARIHYLDKWEASVKSARNNFYVRHPEYVDRLPGAFATNIRSSVESINLYGGMALLIHRAEEQIGRERLDAVLSKLYLEGGTELPPYISFHDFLNACGLTREDIAYE